MYLLPKNAQKLLFCLLLLIITLWRRGVRAVGKGAAWNAERRDAVGYILIIFSYQILMVTLAPDQKFVKLAYAKT